MKRAKRILYVSFDGLLQPLGYSQVVRVITALSARGIRYDVLSLERANDLANDEKVRALDAELSRAGIRWHRMDYDTSGSAKAALQNIAAATARTAELAISRDAALVHGRSYHGAAIGLAVRASTGTPYLFDTRSYWIDERIDEGRWFVKPAAYKAARASERQMFQRAKAVVTLTELQANDVRTGNFGHLPHLPVLAIPTCADYDEFQLRTQNLSEKIPESVRSRLRGNKVIGLVGSLNRSYRIDDSLALARAVLERDPKTHLLILSAQVEPFKDAVRTAGISSERSTVVSVHHSEMPSWLSSMDWAIQMLTENPSKRASMPTKLAEFFAVGIRPVHFGCNEEVRDWIRRAGTGIVLDDCNSATLANAAASICETPFDAASLQHGRDITAAHFSLKTGIDRYEQLFRDVTPSVFE